MDNNIVSAVSGSEELYTSIRGCVISAQKRVYADRYDTLRRRIVL